VTVTTDEVWKRVSSSVSEQEINDAKAYCVALHATRDRLAKDGQVPTADDRRKILADIKKGLEQTYLNLDTLSMQTAYFPSPLSSTLSVS
jgi:hypothetical protein